MAGPTEVQYVSDADGKPLGVIVPIELWQEIESERETAYIVEERRHETSSFGSQKPPGRHLT